MRTSEDWMTGETFSTHRTTRSVGDVAAIRLQESVVDLDSMDCVERQNAALRIIYELTSEQVQRKPFRSDLVLCK